MAEKAEQSSAEQRESERGWGDRVGGSTKPPFLIIIKKKTKRSVNIRVNII